VGAAVALLLLSAAFPRVAAGTTAPEVPGAALPAFEEAAPMELYHSQLMDAHLVAELGRLGAEFQQNYSRLGFENTGYSYGSLRRLALQLEMLPSHEGRQADAPDAGQCSSLPSAMKAVSTAVDVASSDTQARWQRVQQELQLHLMSNCTLAEKVDVVFLGDSLMSRWGGSSFEALCSDFDGACANLAIPGQNGEALLQQAQELTASTCLAPRAWVVLSGANMLADSDGSASQELMAALNNTATHLQHASCHSSVFVMGILPMAAGFGGEHSYRISAAVSLVNRGLSRVANRQDDTQRLRVVDCGNEFLAASDALIDGIHPSSIGYDALSACILPALRSLKDAPKPAYLTNRPDAMVRTNALRMGEYKWVYSAWTCDVSCGQGIATRTTTCVNTHTYEDASPERCNRDDMLPLTSNCNRGQCPQFAWVAGRYGECDKKCGGGVALRTVDCINSLNEVSDAALCYSSATGQRPSTWKRCNQAPCPLLAVPDDQMAFSQELVGDVSEQLGLSDVSEDDAYASEGASDELASEAGTEEKVPPILKRQAPPVGQGEEPLQTGSLAGVAIMASGDDDDDSSDDSRSDDDEEASSDDGNGKSYQRKTLRELLTCYRDSDCGSGYECDPFECSKACSVFTKGQRVSAELRKRYEPEPPSFVYQGMYQAMVFRGTGGICYRKCHHMTDCNKRNSDGTCREWYCRKVEGCHDYPNDYHVPSLEECGVNGLCKPGKCRRRGSNMLVEEGVSATAAAVSSPTACPGRSLPSVSGCCGSGVVSHNGTCCDMGSAVDKDGNCCSADKLDACGVCGGPSVAVDILGQCCTTQLDANGVCCSGGRQVDECGVCGGWNGSCALAPTYMLTATSMGELENKIHSQLPLDLVDAAGSLGFELNDISVYNLTVSSMGEYQGPVSAEVTYKIVPDSSSTTLGTANFQKETSGLEQLTSVERAGICGNGMCEVGEQTRDGWEGSCPTDCSWSGYIPCDCSGHGVCTAATGSCLCHTGYAGAVCSWCDDGFMSIGDDADEGRALCVPTQLASTLSTKVLRKGGLMDWMTETVDIDEMEVAPSSSSSPEVAIGLVIAACMLVIGLGVAVVAHIIKRQNAFRPLRQPSPGPPTLTKGSVPANTSGRSMIGAKRGDPQIPPPPAEAAAEGRNKRYLVPSIPT